MVITGSLPGIPWGSLLRNSSSSVFGHFVNGAKVEDGRAVLETWQVRVGLKSRYQGLKYASDIGYYPTYFLLYPTL